MGIDDGMICIYILYMDYMIRLYDIYIYINYYYFYYDIYQKRFGKCNEMVIVTICYMCIDGMLSISPI